MSRVTVLVAFVSLLLAGAIFGFFFAWVCSTLWGLDTLPAETAIAAMQAMNGSVRNLVFAPAFFGTGPFLLLTALLAWLSHSRGASACFAIAGIAYILGAMYLTMTINVPMNEALAQVDPASADASQIWSAYSHDWRYWNGVRTWVSGFTLLLTGLGIYSLRR